MISFGSSNERASYRWWRRRFGSGCSRSGTATSVAPLISVCGCLVAGSRLPLNDHDASAAELPSANLARGCPRSSEAVRLSRPIRVCVRDRCVVSGRDEARNSVVAWSFL